MKAFFYQILYFAFFTILLPGELVGWGKLLDEELSNSYYARRLLLNPLFECPRPLLLLIAATALISIIFSLIARQKQYKPAEILLYYSIPLYTAVLFILFRLPLAFVIGTPLVCFASIAIWFLRKKRTPHTFLIKPEPVRATWKDRIKTLMLLLPVNVAACIFFQEGYDRWFLLGWTNIFIFFPFAGCLLPRKDQLREYGGGSVVALILCALIHGFLTIILPTQTMEISINLAFLYFELECALLFRMFLPNRKNMSLLILALGMIFSYYVLPAVCFSWVIALSLYILFQFIENRHFIRKKLFSRKHIPHVNIHIISADEFAAQAWGFGALAAAWLAGPERIFQLIALILAVLAGSLIRSKILSDSMKEHNFLRYFPFMPEITMLLLTVITVGKNREDSMTLLAICSCAACLMAFVWYSGTLIGRFGKLRPAASAFIALSTLGTFLFLLSLFFRQIPVTLMLGIFCMLAGVIRLGAASFYRQQPGHLKVTIGVILCLIGQILAAAPPDFRLPRPVWSKNILICFAVAIFAYYLFRIFDFRKRKNKSGEHPL